MVKIKSFIVIAAVVLALATCLNVTASAADWREHWARDVFEDWIRLGILFPDTSGNINPESPVTRGDLCSYINRIMGFSIMADISRYTDTPQSSMYYHAMSVAVAMGYISPTSASTLSPLGPITREQVIAAFAAVARINPSAADASILAQVKDSADITGPNRETVASAIVNGFIAGRSGYRIDPGDYMTVSEAVVLLDRLNASKRVYAFSGRFGAETGSVLSNYSTIIASGATLKNADVARDLEIHREAGGGDVRIENSSVRQRLIINGGGNIYLSKTAANEIELNKSGARLIYEPDGNSDVNALIINGDGVTVDINKGNKTSKIIINGKNAKVNIGENVKIDDLAVHGENAAVNLAAGARLEKVSLNAKAEINGKNGSVGSLEINSGGGGSVVDSKPEVTVIAPGEDAKVDEKPAGTIAVKKITALSFLTGLTLQIATEDVGNAVITANDFSVSIDGAPVAGFTVSKVSGTAFNIILPSPILASSVVAVAGKGNLAGSVSASQNSQARITEATVTGLRTVSVTVTNPANKVFSKENFNLQIAGKATDSFTVAAISLTSYNLTIASDIKSGQVLTIAGKSDLSGSVTVSSVAAIKSMVFNDTDRLTVNTDNTAGNTINADCFDVYINGTAAQNFTVSQRSATAYQITLPNAVSEGNVVRVVGKRFLTGSLEDIYSFPFKVSRAAATSMTNISVTLASVPDSILTAEKHAGAFKVLVDSTAVPVTGIARDPSDRRGAIYNLTVNLSGTQGTLTVNGVKNSNNKGLVDYVPPELVSARMNDRALAPAPNIPVFRTEQSKARLIVEFSEPVFRQAPSTKFANKDVALSGEAFNIIAGAGASLELNGARVSVTANSVVIDLANARRMEPGIYTLTINTALIFDAGGNACAAPANNIFRFEIKGTLPAVASTKQAPTGDIEIKLSGNSADNFGAAMALGGTILIADPTKPVLDSLEVGNRFISYDVRSKTLSISRTALPPALGDPNNPVYLSGAIPYRLELYHRDYSRGAWQVTPADENPLVISRATIDTQRPKIDTVSINGITVFDRETGLAQDPPKVSKSNAVIQIVFSKPVFEQPPSKKFTTVDTYGQAFNIDTANPLDPGNNLSLSGVKVATNNRTVSIPLKSAAVMNPGSYKVTIDPSLIFDAVGNTADLSDFKDLPGFPLLACYFDVVTVSPGVTAVSQSANGDVNVRFTRYYPWLATPYGNDIYNMGIVRILDLSKPEGEQQIGHDITSEYFEPWNATTQTLTIKRMGLPENLTGGPYTLDFLVPDYEKQRTPSVRIVTGINNDPAVTLGGNKNIPVTPNAEQTRIIPGDAIVKITFPIPVTGAADETGVNAALSKEKDFTVTEDISSYAFSVYAEDGEGAYIRLNKDSIKFTHSREQVIIDLTDAITSDMLYMKFTLAVNQPAIYDARGAQIGNKLSVYRFKLTLPPLPINKARTSQIAGTGDVEIGFDSYASIGIADDEILSKARDYVNSICGTNDASVSASTVRVERRGEAIGYIPAEFIKSGVVYEGISPDKIVIKRDALERLVDWDGSPVTLDGGEYNVVLTHSAYADNRTERINIDTTPPVLKDFGASVSGRTVVLSFTFDKDASVIQSAFGVTNQNGAAVSASYTQGYNKTIQVTFAMVTETDSPSDYTVKFTAADSFGNKSRETVSNPLIPAAQRVYGGISTAGNIPGFDNTATAGTGANSDVFRFREGADFGNYFDKTTRRLSGAPAADALRSRIAAAAPSYDGGRAAPAVTLRADMIISAPQGGAAGVRYTVSRSKDHSLQNMPAPGDFIAAVIEQDNGGAAVILHHEAGFYARRGNGGAITEAQMAASNAAEREGWAWTAEELTELSCYYIFEWTMADGRRIFTYVQVDITGS